MDGPIGRGTQMSRKPKYNSNQYKAYVLQIRVIEEDYLDELSEWEREFLESCAKKIGFLSDKQIAMLDKIVKKFFD